MLKPKVHLLLPKHIAGKKKKNCRKLHEKYPAAEKWVFVMTLDEAYLNDSNRKKRSIFYCSADWNDRTK